MAGICAVPTKFKSLDIELGVVFGAIIGFVLMFAYGQDIWDTYGQVRVILTSVLIGTGIMMSLSVVDSLNEFITGMDPNQILSECKRRVEGNLEKAYSLATKRAYTLFVNFFVAWILLGAVNGVLIYYGPPHWLTTLSIGLFSLFGFISLILWIISYLRYRDYSKKLLVIQLKKDEKAEISIKI